MVIVECCGTFNMRVLLFTGVTKELGTFEIEGFIIFDDLPLDILCGGGCLFKPENDM